MNEIIETKDGRKFELVPYEEQLCAEHAINSIPQSGYLLRPVLEGSPRTLTKWWVVETATSDYLYCNEASVPQGAEAVVAIEQPSRDQVKNELEKVFLREPFSENSLEDYNNVDKAMTVLTHMGIIEKQ
jgi:hypothetical protein